MKTIQVTAASKSLFHVAAAQYGDAMQWWRIAQANGISDPDLSGLTQIVPIVIPAADMSNAGGYPVA